MFYMVLINWHPVTPQDIVMMIDSGIDIIYGVPKNFYNFVTKTGRIITLFDGEFKKL